MSQATDDEIMRTMQTQIDFLETMREAAEDDARRQKEKYTMLRGMQNAEITRLEEMLNDHGTTIQDLRHEITRLEAALARALPEPATERPLEDPDRGYEPPPWELER